MLRPLSGALRVLAIGLCLALPLGLAAQEPAPQPAIADAPSALDYVAWEAFAAGAETAIAAPQTATPELDRLRKRLVDWREAFMVAQSTNSARISTLREQMAALGPAPTDGEAEAPDIASRRAELTEQLVTLQAPGIAAEEAYRRADGLIREIDRDLRERLADEFLRLLPSPLNPVIWPEALATASQPVVTVLREMRIRVALPAVRGQMLDNLPIMVFFMAVAFGLLWRGRALVEAGVARLVGQTTARGRQVSALILSLGQILLPTLGMMALVEALRISGLLGIFGRNLAASLPLATLAGFAAHWLGGRIFPVAQDALPLPLSPERRATGRFLFTIYGLVLAFEVIRRAAFDLNAMADAPRAVLAFVPLCIGAFVLWRSGKLLRPGAATPEEEAASGFLRQTMSLFGRMAVFIGLAAPVLAAIGYVPAAEALVYPAVNTLVLFALLVVLQRFIADLYAMIAGEKAEDRGLVPVLAGFGLTLAALPLLALIWGARLSDLTEVWTRLREGFQIGATRISPTDFMVFVVVFAAGYTLTRLFQGALRGALLPRTRMDLGAQTALVSGTGYIGIFLSALIAINTAGLDLSGLAIVAGALSVGIGFGLQNIVSNFVSGIILLIERPVSEGDWIEVGGVQGIVKGISVRSTRIQTFDRNDVIVPNSDLIAGRVTNWTRFNLTGRLIVKVGVAYGSDTRRVERILREIAEAQPLALLNPAPTVVFTGFGIDAMEFEVRVILRDVNFSLQVRTEMNHQIAQRFAEEGIAIPHAQREMAPPSKIDIGRGLQGGPPAPVTKGNPKNDD